MNIIEKLGIKKPKFIGYVMHDNIRNYISELEQQRNELLEAFIESTKDSINMYINRYGASKTTKQIEKMHYDEIKLIEKIAKMSREETKKIS